MIIEYHRPTSLDEALHLLNRKDVTTVPMGGGTILNQPAHAPVAVVDLQSLGLSGLDRQGNSLVIGASTTLQTVLDSTEIQPALAEAIRREATYNLRQIASTAGTLVAAGGRSPFATAILALDANLKVRGAAGDEDILLGDMLPLRQDRLPGRLITTVTIPTNARLAYEAAARTPADLPIVCVAVARWPSGRTRLVVGGFGSSPLLAMDGPEAGGAEQAAAAACSQSSDEWASAQYRQEVVVALTRRCLEAAGLSAGMG